MLEQLGAVAEQLEIPPTGDALVAAIGCWDLIGAKIATAAGEYEAAGYHEIDGATSMVAWLADRGGMSRGRAGVLARRGRMLARLPVTRAACLDGRLSGGQVEAICDNLNADTVDLFAQHEADVLPSLAGLSATDAAVAMRRWREVATADREPPAERPQRLHLSPTLDNRWRLDGTLDAETGEALATALRLAATRDADGEPERSAATRRADALGDVSRFFLDSQGGAQTGERERPHLNLVVDADRLAEHGRTTGETPGGMLFDHRRVDRLLCDCAVHRIVMRGRSVILDQGTRTRTISSTVWNGLIARDRHCRFPGCDRPPHWSEAHHVRPWQHGGPTCPENLVMLCVRHHHLLHQPGWHAKLLPDATLKITDPAGRVRTTRPPGAAPPPNPFPP